LHKKLNLETKVCQNCSRPFAWRKKWERVWDEVRFCSKKCKAESKKINLLLELNSFNTILFSKGINNYG
jgi:hypothetical protein